ncbi:MAG TPA: RodZ domain-containing protein [Nitrospirota bacterium]|nr:RodZ domain-containing protein [Nitrospirota bacterium]
MGTLGSYLSSAREAKGIDLHDAAQQTRISINYLRAMEQEDFNKLPGEVFLKGFLKSYARFLGLEEAEVMKRYQEMRPAKKVQAAVPDQQQETTENAAEQGDRKKLPLEPLLWGAVIFIALAVLLFAALPDRGRRETPAAAPGTTEKKQPDAGPAQPQQPEKLYLEIIALEDTWLLVRMDISPQKKAVLKKGESVIWSADERFLLSYGSAGAVKLLLNGNELTVKAPKNAVVRDLIITKAGISAQRVQTEPQAKPARPKPQPQALSTQQAAPAPQAGTETSVQQQPSPSEQGPQISPSNP